MCHKKAFISLIACCLGQSWRKVTWKTTSSEWKNVHNVFIGSLAFSWKNMAKFDLLGTGICESCKVCEKTSRRLHSTDVHMWCHTSAPSTLRCRHTHSGLQKSEDRIRTGSLPGLVYCILERNSIRKVIHNPQQFLSLFLLSWHYKLSICLWFWIWIAPKI